MNDTSFSRIGQYSDLAGLRRILSRIEVGPLQALFGRKPGRGRPPYDRLPVIYAFLASYYLNVRTIQALVDRLNNDPALRAACGFTGRIPHRSTFSRTFAVLAQHRHLVYQIFEVLTGHILELNPGMGTIMAVDATSVPAWANPNRKKTRDPEAGWTKAHSASTLDSDGMKWLFGYKAHVLVSVEQDLPLAFIVTPANTNDSPMLPPLFRKAQAAFPDLQPEALMADRAYDGRPNVHFLHDQGVAPIIPRRNPANREAGKPIYTIHGEPTCLGGLPMEFMSTHPETGEHGFQCPLIGCELQKIFHGFTVCDDEVWEDPDQNVYEVGGRISRASPEWQELYDQRWEVERYFSLLKDNGWVEEHRWRGLAKVDLHISLAILMYQAMVLDRMVEQGMQSARTGMFRAE